MKLVIAEKPSVAQSLAKVIGATNKKDGYLEGNGFIVSWCVGHLIELANPEKYDEKYSKWRKEDLPIFPAPFSYQVTASTKKQYQVLKERIDNGKLYFDLNEKTLVELFDSFSFSIEKMWISEDNLFRGEQWINVIGKM